MTCIVSWIQDGNVYMGGDSGASDGTLEVVLDNPKVIFNTKAKMLFGCTSSYRMAQLLQYELDVPKQKQKEYDDDLAYLVQSVIPVVRKCFADGGYLEKKDEVESGGFFLIGYKSKAYTVQQDFSVILPSEPYNSCGSGYMIAHGAMAALKGCGHLSVTEKLFRALRVADKHLAYIRPPFVILKMNGKGQVVQNYRENKNNG